MAVIQDTISDKIVDTAIGPVRVTTSTVTGFNIDDHVSAQVTSIAIAIKMYNLVTTVNTQAAKNRRKVSIGGVTVGGY